MRLTTQITGLLTALTAEDVSALPPAARQQLADQCERVHRMISVQGIQADARRLARPRSGVLASLDDGERGH